MRNSLRLFGLFAVLGAVNVYVFFFNHGTAPRDVLKPSARAGTASGPGQAARPRQDEAATEPSGAPTFAVEDDLAGIPAVTLSGPTPAPVPGQRGTAPGVAPPATESTSSSARGGPSGPKGQPGVSPGRLPAERQESGDDEAQNPFKLVAASDTLGQLLAREGFGVEVVPVTTALARLTDPKLIRAGQRYRVRLDEQGEPESFELRPGPVSRFVVSRRDEAVDAPGSGASAPHKWIAVRVDQSVETKVVSLAGAVESSLYDSVQKAGEGSALAGLLVDLLAWDVNFFTDTHPGDVWKVTVEKQLLAGHIYRYGHILAAEYGGKVGTFRAFYWQPARGAGAGHYFDERGQAISKSLLKTPLRYVRVSSRFDRHRLHPILHREKAHLGIDYAAPVGTPVWASSSGRVVECQMKRGSGKTVVLAHANGLCTRYYHLSRFARGLKVGQAVRQKEVIGFVGTTGLSTGPHLHFSVTQNGAFVDPGKIQISRDAPVEDRPAYLAAIRERLALLRQLQPTALARN